MSAGNPCVTFLMALAVSTVMFSADSAAAETNLKLSVRPAASAGADVPVHVKVTLPEDLADLPAPELRKAGTVQRNGYRIEKLVLHPKDGILLPALLFQPPNARGVTYLYVHGQGKDVAAGI